ncbi:MAG: EAL domain-containing protein [Alphaproteobacteria bacterium]
MRKTGIIKHRHPIVQDAIPAHLAPEYILQHTLANDLHPHIEVIDDREYTPSDLVVRENLHKALSRNHIDIFVQPIVTLPQRKTAFYEIFGRLRISSGNYLPAHSYLKLAQEEKLRDRLDTLTFMESLDVLHHIYRKSNNETKCFINIKPSILRYHDYMSILLGMLKNHRNVAQSIVFEMPFRDYLTLSPQEQKVIDGLVQIGCCFSADHLSDIPTDLSMLRARGVTYIKVPAVELVKSSKDDKSFSAILRRKANLDQSGITLIAERIEDESALLCILDYDVAYGQGFLLGKPDFKGVYAS